MPGEFLLREVNFIVPFHCLFDMDLYSFYLLSFSLSLDYIDLSIIFPLESILDVPLLLIS